MKSNIFLIPGYGVPKDILKDENYSFYLKMVFNSVYDSAIKTNTPKNYVIFSGGKTDCFKPYKRTEAEEMQRYMKTYLTTKPYLNSFIKTLQFIIEKNALSSLENFLNTRTILEKKKIEGSIYVFCEKTRIRRMGALAKKVFLGTKVELVPIDFDSSANRYLALEFIEEREKKILKLDLWALKHESNTKRHHTLFKKKIDYLRKSGSKNQVAAVKKWWEDELLKLET